MSALIESSHRGAQEARRSPKRLAAILSRIRGDDDRPAEPAGFMSGHLRGDAVPHEWHLQWLEEVCAHELFPTQATHASRGRPRPRMPRASTPSLSKSRVHSRELRIARRCRRGPAAPATSRRAHAEFRTPAANAPGWAGRARVPTEPSLAHIALNGVPRVDRANRLTVEAAPYAVDAPFAPPLQSILGDGRRAQPEQLVAVACARALRVLRSPGERISLGRLLRRQAADARSDEQGNPSFFRHPRLLADAAFGLKQPIRFPCMRAFGVAREKRPEPVTVANGASRPFVPLCRRGHMAEAELAAHGLDSRHRARAGLNIRDVQRERD